MINNRVFEVLSCASNLIISSFPALTDLLGPPSTAAASGVFYVSSPGDTAAHLASILLTSPPPSAPPFNPPGRALVQAEHSWENRAQSLLGFLASDAFPPDAPAHRVNRPLVVLLYDSAAATSQNQQYVRANEAS
jgi:hypothetical protein